MKKRLRLVRLCFVKKGFDWLINEGWRKKSHRPRIKRRGYTWWKWYCSFFFFCSLSYATTSTHAKTRNSTERHDKEKAKSTYLTARLFLCLLFSSYYVRGIDEMRWPNNHVDSILCGTISPAHTFFSYYNTALLFTPINEKWHNRWKKKDIKH